MSRLDNYAVIIGVLLLLLIAVPAWQLFKSGGSILRSSADIVILGGDASTSSPIDGRSVELVTLLGFDAIPSILEPSFVTPFEAEIWMEPSEQVLGLTNGGESRAYPIKMLSRHEIVNDVVGGMPVAVTW